MTPPVTAPNQILPPPLSCEKAPEPSVPAELPRAEQVPTFQLTYPTAGENLTPPRLLSPNPFDPTRYGLPAEWQAAPAPIALGRQIAGTVDSSYPPRQPAWLRDLILVLNALQRADLDMYNAAVNGGTNLRRFSEFAPKNKPLRAPNLHIEENTTAYVRGEVRPVQGQPDSLITRWVIRYDKPLHHESGLDILGFSAADAPDITYDRSFSGWQAVLDISGGDLDYENPQQTGAPLRTPWNSVAPPLPQGHRDWMIAFNPVVDTIAASIKAAGGFGKLDLMEFWPFEGAIDGGRGKLYLWAFNPTVGMIPQFRNEACDELRRNNTPEVNLPVHCKIRPNTMPRKPGDLLDFFSPLFDSYRGGLLKHKAPYYNPNSEYIAPFVERGRKLLQWAKQELGRDYSRPEAACEDLEGRWSRDRCLLPLPRSYGKVLLINEQREAECAPLKSAGSEEQCQLPIGRQQVPRVDSQVDRINQELRSLGLPEIGRRRGGIIDWGSTELMHDIDRLRAMPEKPHAVARLQLNPGRLALSFGDLEVDERTRLKVEYFANPVQVPDLETPGRTKWEAQVGLRVTVAPLKLKQTDLRALGLGIKADSLEARELRIEIPNILGMAETQPQTRAPITAKIIGGEARGLHLTDEDGNVDIAMKHATIQELNFRYEHPPMLFGSDEDKRNERLERLRNNQAMDCSAEGNPCHEPVWRASLVGLAGTGLKIGTPQIQGFNVARFSIPSIEVSKRFKTRSEETSGDVLTVDIPTLESVGSIDLDLNRRGEAEPRVERVHLEGESELRNLHLSNHFRGDHSLLHASFDLSGTIDKATLSKENLGEITFTTKTNGHPVSPLSGHLSLDILSPAPAPGQTELPKGPPPVFNLDLELPYVGLESRGALTIAPGAATLRNGKVHFQRAEGGSKITGTIEGQLNLQDASYRHQGRPLEMGRMDTLPALKEGHARGNFKFEFFEDGIRLSNPLYNPQDPEHPRLSLGFSLDVTRLHHCPNFPAGPMQAIATGEAFETNFLLQSGQFEAEDLGEFEIRNVSVEGEMKQRLTRMKSGPLFIRKIEGGGSVWVNSFLFGFVRLNFPRLGGPLSDQDSQLPDSRALTSHLPEPYKKKLREDLAGGDFLYAGGINFDRTERGWNASARDVIFNLREQGGLHQYAMLRIPQISFGMLGERLILPPLINHLANVFINIPTRGGNTRITTPERWRRALRGERD